jgi:hypothetical protein
VGFFSGAGRMHTTFDLATNFFFRDSGRTGPGTKERFFAFAIWLFAMLPGKPQRGTLQRGLWLSKVAKPANALKHNMLYFYVLLPQYIQSSASRHDFSGRRRMNLF